jgi:small subunit ribosomal protein S6
MRAYELTFIIRPELDDEGVSAVTEKVSGTLSGLGAQVGEVKRWGRRRLAYPIRKQVEGHYVLMNVDLETPALPELERSLRLNEDVLRYLLVRTEE